MIDLEQIAYDIGAGKSNNLTRWMLPIDTLEQMIALIRKQETSLAASAAPVVTVDTPEFRELISNLETSHAAGEKSNEAEIIAHIDVRIAAAVAQALEEGIERGYKRANANTAPTCMDLDKLSRHKRHAREPKVNMLDEEWFFACSDVLALAKSTREAQASAPVAAIPENWRSAVDGLMDFQPYKRAKPEGMIRGGQYVRKADVIDALSALAAPQQHAHAVHQFRKTGTADWYDGRPDKEDGGGPYEVRTLYTDLQQHAQAAQTKCVSCNDSGVVGTPGAPCPFCAMPAAKALREAEWNSQAALSDELWLLVDSYANAYAEYQHSTERHLAKQQRENVADAKAELARAILATRHRAPVAAAVAIDNGSLGAAIMHAIYRACQRGDSPERMQQAVISCIAVARRAEAEVDSRAHGYMDGFAAAQRAGSDEAEPFCYALTFDGEFRGDAFCGKWGAEKSLETLVDDGKASGVKIIPLYPAPPPVAHLMPGQRRLSVKVGWTDPNALPCWDGSPQEKYYVELVPDPNGMLCILQNACAKDCFDATPKQQDSGRDAALEEAAKICEILVQYPGIEAAIDANLYEAAAAIRACMNTKQGEKGGA